MSDPWELGQILHMADGTKRIVTAIYKISRPIMEASEEIKSRHENKLPVPIISYTSLVTEKYTGD